MELVLNWPSLCLSLSVSVDRLLTPAYRQVTPLEDQLKELLEKLDLSTAMKHSPSRSKRLKLLKKTITEVRSEISLKKSLPAPSPTAQEPDSVPAKSGEKPLPQCPPEPCTPPEEMSSFPSSLELLTSLSQLDTSPRDSVLDTLKATQPSVDQTPTEIDGNADTSNSVLPDPPDGHIPDAVLLNGSLHTETSAPRSQRTNGHFRRSKSTSPQKVFTTQEAVSPPALGAKTILSVVIPRLETLLLPKKRRRCSSADGEEDEETPIKRLGTGTRSSTFRFLF